jgi:hypothetical protein
LGRAVLPPGSHGSRFGRQIFTDSHLWVLDCAGLVIEQYVFDEGYPWPKRSRLLLLDAVRPPLQMKLVELYRGEDPAQRREGYPFIRPIAYRDGTLTYETSELASNGR